MADANDKKDATTIAKQRLRQVFQFLKELNHKRHPPTRRVEEQKWHLSLSGLPNHPTIQFGRRTAIAATDGEELQGGRSSPDTESTNSSDDAFVLRVGRAKLTNCPTPLAAVRDWVVSGWEKPTLEKVEALTSRNEVDEEGETVVVRFQDNPLRQDALEKWQELRQEWRTNELPARAAYRIYERLSELRGTLQRESEKCDLVVGDGLLSWKDPDPDPNKGSVFHPVLLQRVQLEFDPSIPEFKIIDADSDSELYAALLGALTDVDPKQVAESRQDLESQVLHPLMDEAAAYLKALASRLFTNGELVVDQEPPRHSETPLIARSPYLFLRDRVQGFSSAIDNVLKTIDNRTDICSGLFNIVGQHAPDFEPEDHRPSDSNLRTPLRTDEILFGKHANEQQLEVAARLRRSDSVLVQGPPGTGKSHTIANLIGHLLAQHKSVLVTSHTSKALRVLRHHLAEELRPLCVSVLDQDAESREQLKESVQGIAQRLSTDNTEALRTEAERLAERREQLLTQLRELQQQMFNARAAEYRDIVVGGEATTPSDAARFVKEWEDQHDWIPGPLAAGAPMPLSSDEVRELYATNSDCATSDTTHIDRPLPQVSDLLTPGSFDKSVERTSARDLATFDRRFWSVREVTKNTFSDLEAIRHDAASILAEFGSLEPWQVVAVDAGRQDGGFKAAWERLIAEIEETSRLAKKSSLLLIEHPVELNDDDINQQRQLASEIAHRYGAGKRSLPLSPGKRKQWKQAIASWKVSAASPSEAEHFEAIAAAAALRLQRQSLTMRWKNLLAKHDGPDIDSFGPAPEQTCLQYIGRMNATLGWWRKNIVSLQQRLEELTFAWTDFLEARPPVPGISGDMHRTLQAIDEPLQVEIHGITAYLNALIARRQLKNLNSTLQNFDHPAIVELRNACGKRDSAAYESAFNIAKAAINRRPIAWRREKLLAKLEAQAESGQRVAPNWAAEIRNRVGQYGQPSPPGDPQQAWQWRQMLEELQRRADVDSVELARQAECLTTELFRVTNELIDRNAWAAQHARVDLQQRLALNGWLDTVDLLKGGKVVRAAQLRAEARKQLRQGRSAVPVWVMPLARVVESFDFDSAPFEVVVIDEASQCDATALLALMLGRSVIVVGDEEQVSPSAVGQKQLDVQKLIDTYLDGVPNAANYDGRQSIYRLARTAFSNSTCLLEHFRCVPDIIRFSNSLSYANRMKPLREQGSSPLTPAVVAHRVESGLREGYVNRVEALTIASLIAAAIESDDYAGQTIGVICMVGSEQAVEIETELRRHVSPSLLEERCVVCGNAAQFQGDERDVMFLSIVDSPKSDGGPLRMYARDDAKQRYNVAASRARNQMWVVYSLNADTDLQVGDLRRKLIEHARDPHALNDQITVAQSRAASPFEGRVLERLINQRFRVTPQWSVGAYSIDMVVEGGGKRLAVECDGDRYHPIEKIHEDMARQAVLERLGWTFHRIRGSEFFRDPDAAMERLFRRLEAMGIPSERELRSPADAAHADSLPHETSVDKVIRRAAELRAEWKANQESNVDSLLPDTEDLLVRSSPWLEAYGHLQTESSGDQAEPGATQESSSADNTDDIEAASFDRVPAGFDTLLSDSAPFSERSIQPETEASEGPPEPVPHSLQQSLLFIESDDDEVTVSGERYVEANGVILDRTSAMASQELDLPQGILDVLRNSPEPLKAKEIRSRLCEAPFLIHAERRDVNSVLYNQLLADGMVHRSESDGTILWTLSAGR